MEVGITDCWPGWGRVGRRPQALPRKMHTAAQREQPRHYPIRKFGALQGPTRAAGPPPHAYCPMSISRGEEGFLAGEG